MFPAAADLPREGCSVCTGCGSQIALDQYRPRLCIGCGACRCRLCADVDPNADIKLGMGIWRGSDSWETVQYGFRTKVLPWSGHANTETKRAKTDDSMMLVPAPSVCTHCHREMVQSWTKLVVVVKNDVDVCLPTWMIKIVIDYQGITQTFAEWKMWFVSTFALWEGSYDADCECDTLLPDERARRAATETALRDAAVWGYLAVSDPTFAPIENFVREWSEDQRRQCHDTFETLRIIARYRTIFNNNAIPKAEPDDMPVWSTMIDDDAQAPNRAVASLTVRAPNEATAKLTMFNTLVHDLGPEEFGGGPERYKKLFAELNNNKLERVWSKPVIHWSWG